MRFELRFVGHFSGWRTNRRTFRLLRELGVEPDLFVCEQTQRLGAVTVDYDRRFKPTVLADFNALPFVDGAFDTTFFDPPYDRAYKRGLIECFRVTRTTVALLHQLDVAPPHRNPWPWTHTDKFVLTCGPDRLARFLNVWRKTS